MKLISTLSRELISFKKGPDVRFLKLFTLFELLFYSKIQTKKLEKNCLDFFFKPGSSNKTTLFSKISF